MVKSKNSIQQSIVQSAKSKHSNIADDVVNEISTLLESIMSSKEMTRLEISNIANRLIKFQTEGNVENKET